MIEHKCMTPWQVPIQSNSDCQEKVLGNEKIENSMFCAGGEGSGTNKVSFGRIFKGLDFLSKRIYCKPPLFARVTVADRLQWQMRVVSTL